MIAKVPFFEDRRPRSAIVLASVLLWLALGALRAYAQEQVDPGTGQLTLTVTDLALRAEPITLELRRTLDVHARPSGAFGSRWRSNWESRAVSTPDAIVIEELPHAITLARESGATEYRSPFGDRLVMQPDGRFVRWLLDGTTETFDPQGRLIERDYRNGNKAHVRYGNDGRIARVDGPRGSFIQFDADSLGRVSRVETSTGASVRYAYTGGNLTEVQVNGGPILRYAYDARGALTRIDHSQSGAVDIAYDARQRVVSRRWADGAQERFGYDDATNTQRRTDPTGAVTSIQWSADRRRAQIVDPRGGKTMMVFDVAGRVQSLTAATGASVQINYDALGRPVASHDKQGQVSRFEYLGATSHLKSITHPDGAQQSMTYDAQQNVADIKFGGERVAAFTYEKNGSVSTIEGLGSPRASFAYDPNGRLSATADVSGKAVRFDYDSRGNLLRETDRLGGVTQYRYDAQDRLVSQIDPSENSIRYEYGTDGRLATLIEPTGVVTRFRYSGQPTAPSAYDASAPATENTYDSRGRLARRVLPGGDAETYQYDAGGNLVGLTHSSGARWTFDYDAAGQLVEASGPHGYKAKHRYDGAGRLIEYEDALGRKTGYSYDAFGRLATTRNAAGEVWRNEYDASGRLATTIDPLGRRLKLLYDRYDQLLGIEIDGEPLLKLTYQEGRLTGASGPAGSSKRYSHDTAGRVAGHAYANGESFRFKRNAIGQVLEAADGLGYAWRAEYTSRGQLAAVTEPNGARYSYSYTALGQLGKVIDARRYQRTFRYDSLGRQTAETDALGRTTEVTLGPGALIRAVKQPGGEVTHMEYDLLARPTQVRYPGGLTARFRYDAVGNLIEEEMGEYRAAYRYDALDRLVEATYQPAKQTVRYEYDAAGRRQAMEVVGATRWTYRYDKKDRVVELNDSQGRTTRFEYDAAGRVTRQTLPNEIALSRSYDGRGRTLSLSLQKASKELLLERQYKYDAGGNLVQEIREGGGKFDYGYDPNGRLVAVDGPGSRERLAYDRVGNRLLRENQAQYDRADQVKRFGSETFTHDAAGRMVSRDDGKQKVRYIYDAAGRLATIRRDDRVVAEYGYDTQGRRVWKKTENGTRYYVYDGIETLMELDGARQVVQVWTLGPEADRPVSYVQGGKTYFPIADPIGSVVAATDDRGTVNGRWDYGAFGEGRKPALAPDDGRSRGYAGKEFDPESGLYYFLARYYDPRLGRFVTPDPVPGELSNPPSLHPYQYALNNPLRYRDVTGMAPMDVADSIDRGAAGVGEVVGPSLGRTALTAISGPARVINWLRGEEGRKSNERLDQFINKQSGPLGKGAVGFAGSIVSEPLRLGQATGDLRGSRIDRGEKVSAWDQAKAVGTEVFRGAGAIAPIGGGLRLAGAAGRAGVRGAAGALSNYGRAAGGLPELGMSARQKVGEGIIESLGEGAAAYSGGPLAGRTFVNAKWAPQWYPQLYAHEGLHTLISNTANRLGLSGLRDSWYASPIGKFIEETAAHVVQLTHAKSFGGPMGQVFGKSFAPLPLRPIPTTMEGILESVAKNYLGHPPEAAARMAENILTRVQTAGKIAGGIAALLPYPVVTAVTGLIDPTNRGPKPVDKKDQGAGGLPPELVDLSDMPVDPNWKPPHGEFDPRRPGLPGATPEQIARAGQTGSGFSGGGPTTTSPGSRGGTGAGAPQGGYAEPASGGPPGAGGGVTPGAPGVPGPATGVPVCRDAAGNVAPCPPSAFPPGYDPRREPGGRTPWSSLPTPKGGSRQGAPGTQTPSGGGTAGGGTTPSQPGTPPTVVAQNPANPGTATPASPGTTRPAPGGECIPPVCYRAGQKDCLDAGEAQTPRWIAACIRNMEARCNQGNAGGTGQWCVRDKNCAARAKRVCEEGVIVFQ